MNFKRTWMIISLSVMCVASAFMGNNMQAKAANGAQAPQKNPINDVLKTINLKEITDINSVSDYSAVFDADFYYNTYPDLQSAVGRDANALLKHFKEFGMKEGRMGNASFNVKAYMKNNLDLVGLIKADNLVEYYAHYIKYGKQEGRISLFQPGQVTRENVISTHTTYYDPTQSRAKNVELAASRINGTILAPGKSFSFSSSIGTRTVANGYVNGPSFASGREVESIGGGICQVSSNLYVSLLLAGIEPSEHHYHSLTVDYVPLGLDAAISEGYWDLRFNNSFAHKMMIEATAKDGVLTISLLKVN